MRGERTTRAARPIYAAPLAVEPSLDGVRDDWNIADAAVEIARRPRACYAGVYGRFAYLFVTVRDRRRRLSTPTGPAAVRRSDRARDSSRRRASCAGSCSRRVAPGAFRAQETQPRPLRAHRAPTTRAWSAHGRRRATGYAVEVRVPLSARRRGARRRRDRRRPRGRRLLRGARGDLGRGERRAGPLRLSTAGARRAARRSSAAAADGSACSTPTAGCSRTRAASRPPSSDPARDSVARATCSGSRCGATIRRIPASSRPGASRPRRCARALAGEQRDRVVRPRPARRTRSSRPRCRSRACTAPSGAVLLEQASDPILTLTNQALVRLMSFTRARERARRARTARLRRLAVVARAPARARGRDGARPARRDPVAHAGHGRDATSSATSRAASRSCSRGCASTRSTCARSRASSRTSCVRRSRSSRLRSTTSSTSGTRRRPTSTWDGCVKAPTRLDAILAAMSEATQLEQAIGETAAEPFDLAAVVAVVLRVRIATSIASARSRIVAPLPRPRASSAPATSSRSCSTSSSTTP